MFTDGLLHGGSSRTNPGERRILIYRYSPHCMAQRYHYLPSDELLERLNPEARAMVEGRPARVAPGRQYENNEGQALPLQTPELAPV